MTDPGPLSLAAYEAEASRTVNPALREGERLMDAAAGMSEEAGEVLALVRKHLYQGRALDRERLAEELGDVLWCLAIVARTAGVGLEEVAAGNVRKLRERWPEGFGG